MEGPFTPEWLVLMTMSLHNGSGPILLWVQFPPRSNRPQEWGAGAPEATQGTGAEAINWGQNNWLIKEFGNFYERKGFTSPAA